MIDWGILAFFVLQLALTFAIYHAYTLVKAEKSVYAEGLKSITEVTSKFSGLDGRLKAVEDAPADRKRRMDAMEEADTALDKRITAAIAKIDAVDFKVHSLNGRIAAKAKAAKRAALDGDDELDPDPQGEEGEQAQAPHSPGSIRRVEQPQAPGIPSGFGVVRRTGSHG